jgi:hypothetical protein
MLYLDALPREALQSETVMPTTYVMLGYTTHGSPSVTAEPARYLTLGYTAFQVR